MRKCERRKKIWFEEKISTAQDFHLLVRSAAPVIFSYLKSLYPRHSVSERLWSKFLRMQSAALTLNSACSKALDNKKKREKTTSFKRWAVKQAPSGVMERQTMKILGAIFL